jgi:hypothetical protein
MSFRARRPRAVVSAATGVRSARAASARRVPQKGPSRGSRSVGTLRPWAVHAGRPLSQLATLETFEPKGVHPRLFGARVFSACSTWRRARGTWPSAPPRRERRWWRRTSRGELRSGPPRGPRARSRAGVGGGRCGGAPLRRRRVRRRHVHVRCDVRPRSPEGGRRARACAGLEARSACSTSRPRAWRPTSSASSRRTCRRLPRERCRRFCGGARSTCESPSATGSSRSR